MIDEELKDKLLELNTLRNDFVPSNWSYNIIDNI